MARPCSTTVIYDQDFPNPSFVDCSRVVQLAVDTGPPPDAVVIDCEDARHARKRRKRWLRRRR